MSLRCCALICTFLPLVASRADEVVQTDGYLDQTRARWEQVSRQVWEFAETSLQEKQSAELFENLLEKEGFKVERGVGALPTAFVATAGSGSPVVAVLAEYDALPELSQKGGEAARNPVTKGAPGHGCGHNLLGTAAVAAGVAANRARVERKLPGTIQIFGTPAEEILIGKTFMIMAGAFKSTDVALSWHPGDKNEIAFGRRLALTASDVEFFGKAAHAAASPWLGRSALDAMELFEHAMSLMREHVQPTARIHRVIKNGGAVANIIPDYSKVQVWLRDANIAAVEDMLARMRKAADGAALATETRAKVTVLGSVRDPISNEVLGRTMQKELDRVGGPRWEERDTVFAKALQKEVGVPEAGLAAEVLPFGPGHGDTASSDIGEVSAVIPLAELRVATRPLGTASHHWGMTACSTHPVGTKGMMVAAKVLGASVVDLLADPAAVAAAKAEFAKATKGKPYVSALPPDAKPAVF
jgi:aminobenzoyl-glutamate utilization protein B